MKIIGGILVILALCTIFIPQFYTCQYHGKAIHCTKPNLTIPMKCLYSARAEIAMGVILTFVGGFLFFSRQRETRRVLSAIGVLLGIFILLLVVGKGFPAPLIGVCMKPDMPCVTVMQSACYAIGIITIVASLVALVLNFLPEKWMPPKE
ncbi:MAG: DUF4418 family protein [Desulfatiglans sp.]|nr:DUF4418 family protein [Desulfatiglans sp.]